jgi:hypothetical protein
VVVGGSIPDAIGDLKLIQSISMANNGLTGQIPSTIGKLQNTLTTLDLSYNSLENSLPWQLGTLYRLKLLDLSHNKLVGTLPMEVVLISHVPAALLLRKNNLLGARSTQPDCVFSSLFKRKTPGVCNFTGNELELPMHDYADDQIKASPYMTTLSYAVRHLAILDLRNQMLVGSVPEGIVKLSVLEELVLFGNKFSEPMPPKVFHYVTKLKYFNFDGSSFLVTEKEEEGPTFSTLNSMTSTILYALVFRLQNLKGVKILDLSCQDLV